MDDVVYSPDEARAKRNELLAETDWWAVSDRSMTQAQADYRQTLRDLPQKEGYEKVFIEDNWSYKVTWPTKPE